MNKSDKVGYYGEKNYGDYPNPDYDFFYSQNNNNQQNAFNSPQPQNNNNWNQNYGNNNGPTGSNGTGPINLFNIMENNLNNPNNRNLGGLDYPQKPLFNGPKSIQQQKANEYINQRLFKNLIRGSMTQPQPVQPIIQNQSPPGLMVGTVYAKPVKNRGYGNGGGWGYRVGSEAPQQQKNQ